jgi:hypothetical protein
MERIEQEYAYSTECDLATLEELISIKSSSNSRIERQRTICLRMLQVCKAVEAYLIFPDYGCRAPRVRDMLAAAKHEAQGLEGALDRYIQKLTASFRPKKS